MAKEKFVPTSTTVRIDLVIIEPTAKGGTKKKVENSMTVELGGGRENAEAFVNFACQIFNGVVNKAVSLNAANASRIQLPGGMA